MVSREVKIQLQLISIVSKSNYRNEAPKNSNRYYRFTQALFFTLNSSVQDTRDFNAAKFGLELEKRLCARRHKNGGKGLSVSRNALPSSKSAA